MAKSQKLMIKFDRIDAKRIRGKRGHSRTGACTCKYTEKCFHGNNNPRKQR